MVTLRRYVAMLLLAVFGLPIVLSSVALGQDPEAGLPACCRRTGTHHCGMSLGERTGHAEAALQERVWKAPIERCPYCPASPAVSVHLDVLSPGAMPAGFGFAHGPAALIRRAECSRRIARERARHKRGPPSVSLA